MKRSWYLFVILPILAMVLAVIWSASKPSSQVSPSAGEDLAIVSLTPNVTEILFAIGMGDCVVGISKSCDYPPEAKGIQCIGDVGNPNLEVLLALKPDIIFGTNVTGDAIEKIRHSGVKFINLKITNFQEFFEAITLIGKETSADAEAKKLVLQMRNDFEQIRKRFAHIPVSDRHRVFIEIWDDPVMTVGNLSYINEVITSAGGVNVAGELNKKYPTISSEKVIQWNPDVILLSHRVEGDAAKMLSGRIGWPEIKAVKQGNIIASLDPSLYQRLSPRLVDGVRKLSQLLYPELYQTPREEDHE